MLPYDNHISLMAAIREHPDEDTPKLAYADYLAEQGDGARAAFIRGSIDFENKVKDHNKATAEQTAADTEKENELQRRIGHPPHHVESDRKLFKQLLPSERNAYHEWLAYLKAKKERKIIKAPNRDTDLDAVFISDPANRSWKGEKNRIRPPECATIPSVVLNKGFVVTIFLPNIPSMDSTVAENFWRGILTVASFEDSSNTDAMRALVQMPGYHAPKKYVMYCCPPETVAALGESPLTENVEKLLVTAKHDDAFIKTGESYTAKMMRTLAAQPHFKGLRDLVIKFTPLELSEGMDLDLRFERLNNYNAVDVETIAAFATCPHLQKLDRIDVPLEHAELLREYIQQHPTLMPDLTQIAGQRINRNTAPGLPAFQS